MKKIKFQGLSNFPKFINLGSGDCRIWTQSLWHHRAFSADGVQSPESHGWKFKVPQRPGTQSSLWIRAVIFNFMSTSLGREISWVLVKHCFWMCLWGCSQRRLAFEVVDCLQQIAFPNVGVHHPISWEPEENKKAEKGWIHFSLTSGQLSPALSAPGSHTFGLGL